MNPLLIRCDVRKYSLTTWLLISAGLGIFVGYVLPSWAPHFQILSNLFLRLIRSIIAPILVAVLIRAVAGAGSMRDLGRLGWKSFLYFEVVSTIALLLGWFTAAIVQPGRNFELRAEATEIAIPDDMLSTIENAVPTSIVDAMARGDILQILVFSFLFGLACLSVGEKSRPIVDLAEALTAVAFRYADFVMKLAPLAVFAATAHALASHGASGLGGLALFVGSAWAAQLAFLIVVIGGSLVLCAVPVGRFARYAREPFMIAFATTSSAAALPQTLENMEMFGVPKRILGVVTPLSLVLNLNGSTIHLAMATLFVVQASAAELSWSQQLVMLLTLKLTSKGVAGVPRANFVILAAIFGTFGLPMEGLAILLGIDALIDPVRTSVNVVSHCSAPAIVARFEAKQLTRSAS